MMFKKMMSWLLIVTIVLPVLVSCKESGENSNVTREIQRIESSDEMNESTRVNASKLLKIRDGVFSTIRKHPRLKALPANEEVVELSEAQKLHNENMILTLAVLDNQKVALKKLVDNVRELSKIKFNKGMDSKAISESETLLLMNLLSVRQASLTTAQKILVLMTKFDKTYFDQVPENAEMKKRLFADYTEALAISAITANDLHTTLTGLSEMRKDGLLNGTLENSITGLVGNVGGAEKQTRSEVHKFLKESITEKAMDTFNDAISKYHEELKGKTFLYDPSQADHPLIHVLVIVSNLTWGLCNTLVGLGFVITAAILAPVTQGSTALIRAFGYEPLFMEMRFPRLAIADNNMQIYADVCGLGIANGKMSAGLFELDFCSWKSFASNHEGGHAKQSAILGPLYFPAAILSYALNLGHGGFIEDWADAWAVS